MAVASREFAALQNPAYRPTAIFKLERHETPRRIVAIRGKPPPPDDQMVGRRRRLPRWSLDGGRRLPRSTASIIDKIEVLAQDLLSPGRAGLGFPNDAIQSKTLANSGHRFGRHQFVVDDLEQL
jgi:hypothetical protein